MREPLIVANNVRKSYDMAAGPLHILKGADFSLEDGGMAFILGRSGSGKSTLLHLLGGLDTLSSGKIHFQGEDMTRLNERQLAHIRNQKMGFVFQFYHLLPELTVYENVILPLMIAGKKDSNWVKEMLRRVKLFERRDHYPNELSGGERQRVAIARALANRPAVAFCDEPTGNLDEETADSVFALLNDLHKRDGQAFVIVTHDESLAWRYPNVVYRLHDGVLVKEDRGHTSFQKG